MVSTVKISDAGAHASAAATDRIPASKAGVKGYLTNSQILAYILAALVSDTAYDATSWNGVTDVAPSKNAVRDKIEAIVALLADDTAYASTWNGVTTIPPSKNAVYDMFEARFPVPITAAWVTSRPYTHQFNNGAAMAADTIYYVPVYIWNRRTISDLGIRLNATTSANNVKLGVYANNASTNQPTGNVLAATANISMGSTGNLTADVSGADVTLNPGLYWFAIWAEGTTGSVASNGSSVFESQMIGNTTLASLVGDNQNWGFMYTSAESFAGGTFPDATSETFSLVTSATAARSYAFFMKVV